MSPPSIHHWNQLWWTLLWPVIKIEIEGIFCSSSSFFRFNGPFLQWSAICSCFRWLLSRGFLFSCICVVNLTTTNCQLSKDFFFLLPYLFLSKTGILKLAYSFSYILDSDVYFYLLYRQQQQRLFKYRIQDWLGVKRFPFFPSTSQGLYWGWNIKL